MSRFIISCVGMPNDQCKQIEDELNDSDNDHYIWIFDKPHEVVELVDDEKYVISLIGAPANKINILENDLHELSGKTYTVTNRPIELSCVGRKK